MVVVVVVVEEGDNAMETVVDSFADVVLVVLVLVIADESRGSRDDVDGGVGGAAG